MRVDNNLDETDKWYGTTQNTENAQVREWPGAPLQGYGILYTRHVQAGGKQRIMLFQKKTVQSLINEHADD